MLTMRREIEPLRLSRKVGENERNRSYNNDYRCSHWSDYWKFSRKRIMEITSTFR